MSQPKKLHYLGTGLFYWWFDRFLILIAAALFWSFTRFFFGWRVKVSGQEHMPHHGRVLLLTNHPSYVGVFLVLYAVLWPWVLKSMNMVPIIVGKQKYFRYLGPIRWLLLHLRIIELPEKSEVGAKVVRREVVRRQVDVLARYWNCLLWVYGECTRTPADERLDKFLAGVGRVVAEAVKNVEDLQIVFVWDQGSQAVWPKGQWPRWPFSCRFPFYRPFPATVSISRSLPASDPTTRLHQLCRDSPLDESGEPVAKYLRDLLWAFAASQHPELVGHEVADLLKVWPDLRLILGKEKTS